jgi:hypothetical protein
MRCSLLLWLALLLLLQWLLLLPQMRSCRAPCRLQLQQLQPRRSCARAGAAALQALLLRAMQRCSLLQLLQRRLQRQQLLLPLQLLQPLLLPLLLLPPLLQRPLPLAQEEEAPPLLSTTLELAV